MMAMAMSTRCAWPTLSCEARLLQKVPVVVGARQADTLQRGLDGPVAVFSW